MGNDTGGGAWEGGLADAPGWRPARGQTGVSQRVHVGFLRSRPPDTPHRISLRLAARLLRLPLKGGVIALGRGRPARILSLWPPLSFRAMLLAATLSAGTPSARPKESHGAVPVDPSGGDGQGCSRLGAGGTPALPGAIILMTSSHQGHKIAEAFWCRLWLKQVHLSSGLFVFLRVHSWFVFINDQRFFLE